MGSMGQMQPEIEKMINESYKYPATTVDTKQCSRCKGTWWEFKEALRLDSTASGERVSRRTIAEGDVFGYYVCLRCGKIYTPSPSFFSGKLMKDRYLSFVAALTEEKETVEDQENVKTPTQVGLEKDELIARAKEEFGVDLDKRKSFTKLKKEFGDLLDNQ